MLNSFASLTHSPNNTAFAENTRTESSPDRNRAGTGATGPDSSGYSVSSALSAVLPSIFPTRHPALARLRPGATCPAMGQMQAPPMPTESNANFLVRSLQRVLGAIWNPWGASTSAAAAAPEFTPLRFSAREGWPKATDAATPREREILDGLVAMIEEHANGLYENVLKKIQRSGRGVSEGGALLNPDLRVYVQRPGNLYEQMQQFVGGLTANECRLLYATLAKIDKHTALSDDILIGAEAKQDGFQLDAAQAKNRSIVDFYLSKKRPAEAQKVPGIAYHGAFLKTGGLRPNTKKLPVLVTEQIAYHAACAILFDALKLHRFPEIYKKSQEFFDNEKVHARQRAWECAMRPDRDVSQDPEFMPKLPASAFDGVELPRQARIVPALVAFPVPSGTTIETTAAVAIHPDTRRCLIEFLDHTRDRPAIRYAVSQDRPPMGETRTPRVETFDDPRDALSTWTQSAPELQP